MALGVVFGKRRFGAVGGLAAAKAGDPDRCACERPRKRLQLAHAATGMPGFDAFVKAVQAVFRRIGVDIGLFGLIAADVNVVLAFGLVDQRHRLWEEAAGLQASRHRSAGDDCRFQP